MAAVSLIGSYNYALVALSVLIAMFASYAALDLAGRVTAAGGWNRAGWLLGGAGAMGTGIWSMHYIGMLAFILPISVAYHWPTVLLSLFAAFLASVIALYVVSREKMGASRAVTGSVLMGSGIASMHYIGMSAMRLPATCHYDSFLVALSVVFAVLISLAALWITFHFRDEKTGIGREKLAGAVAMGVAIPIMHYTGMAAARFTPSGMPANLSHAVSISTLGTAGIAAVTFIVLGLALLTSSMDRRFAAHTLELQEQKLQRSETYLAEAQRLSKTGSFGWKPSTGELIWSEETFRIFQYDGTAIPSVELVLQRVHPEDVAVVQQTIERAAQDRKAFDFEHRLLMPDGSVKYVRVVGHSSTNDESGNVEFVGALMDVTETKRVEKQLRRSEESLLEAQKLSHAGSWRHDVASGEVTVSPEIYRIHDIKPDENPSSTEFFFNKFHPEDRKRVVDLFERAEMEKTEFQVDYRIVLPDGTIKYLHTIGRPILSESGDLVEFVGTAIDVTAAKQAEETLRRSEAYLAEAQRLTHTGSGAWRVPGWEALHLSEEWYRIYGFDPKQGLSAWKDRLQRMHPEDQTRVQETKDRAIREKSDYEVDHRILLPDGTLKYTHTVGHPVLNASGEVEQFVCTMMDITERKQAEEALRQAQADLARISRVTTMGELTASLAHEVNQPIAAAVTDANTCLRWLKRDDPDIEEASHAASRVIKDATRAAEIISRIRLLFKKAAPQRELVDVNEIIREMVVLLRGEITQHNISVGTDLAADVPQVLADRVQLQQVLMNLIINGIEATKDTDWTRELAINSRRAETDQVLVCVCDNGVGLSPEKTKQMFNAFFTTKPQGTGMGLRISRSIIESHGGRLWAAGNSSRGASFYFTLPTNAEPRE